MQKEIFDQTIELAQSHGIKLKADKPNPGVGNCLFESIVDNINHRPKCFNEKLDAGVAHYREVWVSEVEERYKETPHYPGYGGQDVTNEQEGEWTAAWASQMNDKEFNVNHFNVSDLTPPALGHCIRKDILVFSNDPFEPVKVL